MRVVHFKTRFLNAGADENTLYSCNWSVAHGDEVFLLIGPSADTEILGRLDPRVKVVTIPTMVNPISPFSDLRALLDSIRALRDLKPDLVHTHTSKAGIVGRAAARLTGVPAIVHGVHIAPFLNVNGFEKFVYLTLEKLAAGWTDAFIDVSRGMRDAFLKEKLGTLENHFVIHSGMDIDEFRKPTPVDDWRGLLGCNAWEQKPPVILMLAAFEKRKRHVELIRAFDEVLRRIPEARLVLAGDGTERATIETAIKRSVNPERIRLIGFHANPGGLIALADLCVHCSTREGLPRVIVQYMAGGKPVVMTDLPGIDEVVHGGNNGFLVSENDFSSLAERIVSCLSDAELLARLQLGAASTDVNAWSIEAMCKSNQLVYDGLYAPVSAPLASRVAG
jgi:glycosyltransferase involved in cell wall biosynthesis